MQIQTLHVEVAVKLFLMSAVQVVPVLWSWSITQRARVKRRRKEYAYGCLDTTVTVPDVW